MLTATLTAATHTVAQAVKRQSNRQHVQHASKSSCSLQQQRAYKKKFLSEISRPVDVDYFEAFPVSLDPVSLDPVSLDPVSLDPVSLDPVSLDPAAKETTPDPEPVALRKPVALTIVRRQSKREHVQHVTKSSDFLQQQRERDMQQQRGLQEQRDMQQQREKNRHVTVSPPVQEAQVQEAQVQEAQVQEAQVQEAEAHESLPMARSASAMARSASAFAPTKKRLLSPGAQIAEIATMTAEVYKFEQVQFPNLLGMTPMPDDEYEVEFINEAGNLDVVTISAAQIRRPPITAKFYKKKVLDLTHECNKKQVNRVVAQLCSRSPHKDVLVLDEVDLQTSKALRHVGFTAAQIHVTNPDPNFHATAQKNIAELLPQSLLQCIQSLDTEETPGSYHLLADYCCTVGGNDNCKPTLDITEALRRTLLAKVDGVLWVTFSTRGEVGGAQAVRAEFCAWLKKTALHYDYTFSLAYEKAYGTVVTMMFVTGRANVQIDFTYLQAL